MRRLFFRQLYITNKTTFPHKIGDGRAKMKIIAKRSKNDEENSNSTILSRTYNSDPI